MSEEQRAKLCYATVDPATLRIYEVKDGKAVRIQDEDGLLHKNHLDTEMRYIMEDFYAALIHYK